MTTMDPTLLAAAIVTVIAALGGVIVQIINASSAARDRREAAAERKLLMEKTNIAAVKTDTLVTNTEAIHIATNSINSNLQKALELMTEKNIGLERALAQAKETRQTVAAAQAVTDMKSAIAATPPSQTPTAEKSLGQIDANTAAIERNTANTDATVNELKKES